MPDLTTVDKKDKKKSLDSIAVHRDRRTEGKKTGENHKIQKPVHRSRMTMAIESKDNSNCNM